MGDNATTIAPRFVTVATAWGTAHGGVNAFNYDFSIGLAREVGQPVACVVPGASPQETAEALANKVHLLSAGETAFSEFAADITARVLERNNFSKVGFWIGHDIITGEVASQMRDASGAGQLAVIMHQSYHDYAAVKHSTGATTEKSRRQKHLFSRAEHRFAVGPLLEERLGDLVTEPVNVLLPGLNELTLARARSTLNVLVFGRLTQDNALMKGTALACNAVGEAVRIISETGIRHPILYSPVVKLIGVEDGDTHAATIKHEVETRANRCVNVHLCPFLERKVLLDEMDGSNLCLMLSWHEGFGLSGWEAIAAGIPLILSRNSGLYRFLDELGGHATGCVHAIYVLGSSDPAEPYREEDLRAASHAVIAVADNIGRAIENAEYLRRFLIEKGYTWERTAKDLVRKSGGGHFLRPETPPHQVTALQGPYVGFSEGLDNARLRERLNIARVLYQTCYYERALAEVRSAANTSTSISESIKPECHLLESEILLRLNQHTPARSMARQVAQYYEQKADWQRVVKARGIINTVERALCRYQTAVRLARENASLAELQSKTELGSALRDLARSLALAGDRNGEAESVARRAIDLAGNGLERAKAYLALGEAYRHARNQDSAIDGYLESIRWATTIGHYDCLIWSSLGLADSLFLQGKLPDLDQPLSTVQKILSDPERHFPLETLHYQLSVLSLKIRQDGPDGKRRAAKSLLAQYSKMGVTWPNRYMESTLRGRFSLAKSF
jgi:glycosyltransferase involved in cell wall biosynthesis